MASIPIHWPQTWPGPVACQFSIDRAQENAVVLQEAFGEKWIEKGVVRSWSAKEHPIISQWRWGGAEAYLELNALAEDLRLVKSIPGFPGVVRELKQPKDYPPTRHMLRSAALIARGGNPLSRFFTPGSDTAPDFETSIGGQRTPAEAKLLTQSRPWREFCARAWELQEALIDAIYPDGNNHPITKIVVKNHDRVPSLHDAVQAVQFALRNFDGRYGQHRGELMNVFLSAAPSTSSAADFVSVQIMAPRSDTEEGRAEQLVRKANRQLRNNAQEIAPGLMCLSITQHQDPHIITRFLQRKFDDNQFRSISGVLIHRSAQHRGPPPLMILDQLAFIQNPNAHVPLQPLSLGPVGGAPSLLDDPPPASALSCYAVGKTSGRILAGDTSLGLSIPTVLLPEALQ